MSIGGKRRHAILGVNTHATYRRFVQKQPLKFLREDLVLLTAVKDAVHDNINPFLGERDGLTLSLSRFRFGIQREGRDVHPLEVLFSGNDPGQSLRHFRKSHSVQDIIYNKNMTLDEKFHAAFVRDITLVRL